MKRFVNVLWYCWMAVGILWVCQLGYRLYDIYVEEKKIAQMSAAGAELNDVLILDGDIDKGSLAKVELYYQAVPLDIRKQFAEDGWKLVVTDQDISSTYYNGPVKGELAGLADSLEKKLYVHEDHYHIRNALLHEFGHYLDFRSGMVSNEDTFNTCYETEKEAFDRPWNPDTHAMSSEAEYFAESFQQYILEPATCKEHQPLTYEYIAALIETSS